MGLKKTNNKKKKIMHLYIKVSSKLKEVTMVQWCRRLKSLWQLMMMISLHNLKVTMLAPKSRWVGLERRKRRVVQKLKV